eukprot:236116_1
MPRDIIPLYGNFIDNINNNCDDDDAVEYYSIDNIFLFIKEKYPPPCNVEFIKRKVEQIIIRWQENPISVYNKIASTFCELDETIDLINEDLDAEEHIPELTNPYKYKILLKSFVQNNNSPKYSNVSFMNNRIREFIVEANPLNYTSMCRQILLLGKHCRPKVEAGNQ